MFTLGDTVAIYPHSDTDDVPVGAGTLTATSPKYELRDIRWRAADVGRTRLWFDVASRVEVYEGHYMVRPECHARDSNLLAKWFAN